MAICTARGAITTENEKMDILSDTKLMIESILKDNNIKINSIISILFTCTSDLDAVYPAVAARGMGINKASLMCANEMKVVGSLEKCIRVMITFNTWKTQSKIKYSYLKGAKNLRPDLTK